MHTSGYKKKKRSEERRKFLRQASMDQNTSRYNISYIEIDIISYPIFLFYSLNKTEDIEGNFPLNYGKSRVAVSSNKKQRV